MFEKLFGRDPVAGRHRQISGEKRTKKQDAAYRQARKEARQARTKGDGPSKGARRAAVAAALSPTVGKLADGLASKPAISASLHAAAGVMATAPALQVLTNKSQDDKEQTAQKKERKAKVQEQLEMERPKHPPTQELSRQPGRHRSG